MSQPGVCRAAGHMSSMNRPLSSVVIANPNKHNSDLRPKRIRILHSVTVSCLIRRNIIIYPCKCLLEICVKSGRKSVYRFV